MLALFGAIMADLAVTTGSMVGAIPVVGSGIAETTAALGSAIAANTGLGAIAGNAATTAANTAVLQIADEVRRAWDD